MFRVLLGLGLGVSFSLALFVPVSGQQPKAKAKALPRIAIDEPTKAIADPDYAIQGEYTGESEDKSEKWGAQVVALGEGQFDVKFLKGGLPGAGWDGSAAKMARATRVDGKVTVKVGDKVLYTIADGVITLADSQGFPLRKTERKSPTLGLKPPAAAVVLWADEKDVSHWDKAKVAELSDGKFLSVSKAGDLRSKQAFGSFKAHVEFRLAWMPNSRGQGRSNSGVYFQDRYECQVLDSFGLKGENNECGGIYTQHKPSVNMCLPPMQWQTYDIEFTAAKFDGDKKTANARLTVKHNGVTIHDNVELPKDCPGGKPEAPSPGPFRLQDHGDPVVYRNIWVVETK